MSSQQRDESNLDRRTFLHSSTVALAMTGAAGAASGRVDAPTPSANVTQTEVEWRNRQEGMAYRRLGRTGMMISEVVSGGDPITPENYKHLDIALERGLNYLDMAPQYHRGETERAYGMLLGGSSAKREKVFLTTKISGLTGLMNRLYREVFDGLNPAKQDEIRAKALQLREDRGVELPGYYLTYWPGQQGMFEPAYLRIAMMPEFAHRVEGSQQIREHIINSVEGSLKRVGTDYFDLVMSPHGADTPEDVQVPEIFETIDLLKQQGKLRFLGVTAHNDPAGVLQAAAATGHYDAAMIAYNVINGGFVDTAIRFAHAKDVGVIGMKVAMAVATHHKALQPIPDWRIAKVNRIVPGDMKPPLKAYTWSLQNPRIAAVISNLWDPTYIEENLSIAGKKVELRSA